MKLAVLNRFHRLGRRTKGAAVKTKVGYENLNIAEKAAEVKDVSADTWKASLRGLKTIFQKPVRMVSHFGLILVILVVLFSGIPAPKVAENKKEIPVDPFGMIHSTMADTEQVDLTELEVLATTVAVFNTNMANKVYEKISSNENEAKIVLAGNTIANASVIATESSAEIKEKFKNYTVQSGDTLSTIAAKFSVTTNSIKWSNSNVKNIDNIKPGMKLKIPTVSGIIYKVQKGDSIDLIAAKYKSKSSLIISYNDLYGEDIEPGMTILIPNGQKTDPKPTTTTTRIASSSTGSGRYGSDSYIRSTGNLRFPTIAGGSGYYNGYHWWAIDIPNSIGTPIYAADSGRVVEARYGWNGGYGNTILIDHGNGMQTRYAHMTTLKILGGYVSKGQVIGYMGSTGRSTGSHLHFEVMLGGSKVNPMRYF